MIWNCKACKNNTWKGHDGKLAVFKFTRGDRSYIRVYESMLEREADEILEAKK